MDKRISVINILRRSLFFSLLLVLWLSAAQVIAQDSATNVEAQVPITLAPADGQSVHSTTPTFEWTSHPEATHYRVLLTDGAGQTVSETWLSAQEASAACNAHICSFQPSEPLGRQSGEALTWQVRPYAGGTALTDWSSPSRFTLIGPLLRSPEPDAVVSQNDTGRITYHWLPMASVSHYQLVVTRASRTVVDLWAEADVCTNICTLTPDIIIENGIYQWGIRGWSQNGYTPWSATSAFTQAVPAPTIPTAATGASLEDGTVSLSWMPADHATHYEVHILNEAQRTVHQQWYARSELSTVENQFSTLVDISGSGIFEWYLRAGGPGGSSEWVGPQTFSVSALPAPDGLGLGSSDITRGDRGFQWNHISGATWYEIHLTDDGGESIVREWYEVGDAALNCANGVCRVFPEVMLRSEMVYSFTVRAYSPAGLSRYAEPLQIEMPRVEVPSVATLTLERFEPRDVTLSEGQAVYRFPTAARADYYQLLITTAEGDTVHRRWYRSRQVCDDSRCELQPAGVFLRNNSYQWFVRAFGPGGLSEWVGPVSFTVGATDLAGTVPIPTSPVNQTLRSAERLTYTWEQVPDATWYRFYLYDTVNNTLVADRWEQNACQGEQCSSTLPQPLPNGTYSWYIQAYGSGGLSEWSEAAPFTVNVRPPDAPLLHSPADASVTWAASTGFHWNTAAHANWYRLEITDMTTDEIVFDRWYSPREGLRCTEDTCSVELRLPPGQYVWRMATWGYGSTDDGTWSENRQLTVLD